MRTLAALIALTALMLLAACAAPRQQPPASTPPSPDRPENAAVASGTITDASGRPVASARVTAWAADAACRAAGTPVSHVSGADGTYQLRVAHGVGPEFDGCIIIEAAAGGSVVRAQRPVHYASDAAGRNGARVDLMLPQPPLLTRNEADRLIDVLRRAIQLEQDAIDELKHYIPDAPTALTPIAQHTRGIASVRLVSEGDRRFVYELVGRRPERNVQITIAQDVLTRIELP
jgi:hypothetical protein